MRRPLRASLAQLAFLPLIGCGSEPIAIEIEPAGSTVEILNGAIVTPAFRAVARLADGTTEPVDDAVWSASDARVGIIDTTGLYTPTGDLGGVIEIGADARGTHATTTLIVKIHIVDDAAELDAATRAALVDASRIPLDHASHDPAITWSYPYDGTVFPRGLEPPLLMWNGGLAADWYYVHLSTPTFELESFHKLVSTANEPLPASRFTIASARWTQLSESTAGAVDVAISRLAAGSSSPPTAVIHHQWSIAPARLPGTIYYWTSLDNRALAAGRMRALDLGAGSSAVDFLADYRPTGQETCPKCHTPSADGRHMVFIMGDPFPNEKSVTYDLVTGTTIYAGFPAGGGWGGAALSPHGDVLVPSFAGIRGRLGIAATSGAIDPRTATPLANTGLETIRPWMPAFSPDGRLLVYVDEVATPGGCQFASGQGAVDGVALQACSSDLRAVDWDPALHRATNDRRLVAKANDQARAVIQYPQTSPDHKLVVYGRGPEIGSFSHIDHTQTVPGDLLSVRTDAPDVEVELAALSGRDYPLAAGDRDRHADYEPAFAPITAGGYAWVVFVSRRTYGNVLTGPGFIAEGSGGVKQLWIAAIDPDAPAGADPSHPAFWLPGQDISTTDARVINQRARWTLSPCFPGDADCITLP